MRVELLIAGAGLVAVLAHVVCGEIVRRRYARSDSVALIRDVLAAALVGIPFGLMAPWLGGRRAGWW